MTRDIVHDLVKNALIKDGWRITHDPFPIEFGLRKVYADLGADKLLGAEKGEQKIVVEIKSFLGLSLITELERALGQFVLYKSWLVRSKPDRVLFIALGQDIYDELFRDIAGEVLIEDYALKIIVVDMEREEIVRWIS